MSAASGGAGDLSRAVPLLGKSSSRRRRRRRHLTNAVSRSRDDDEDEDRSSSSPTGVAAIGAADSAREAI